MPRLKIAPRVALLSGSPRDRRRRDACSAGTRCWSTRTRRTVLKARTAPRREEATSAAAFACPSEYSRAARRTPESETQSLAHVTPLLSTPCDPTPGRSRPATPGPCGAGPGQVLLDRELAPVSVGRAPASAGSAACAWSTNSARRVFGVDHGYALFLGVHLGGRGDPKGVLRPVLGYLGGRKPDQRKAEFRGRCATSVCACTDSKKVARARAGSPSARCVQAISERILASSPRSPTASNAASDCR